VSFGEQWKRAANEKIEPPKGEYKVEIVGGSAFTSRDGDDYCKLDLLITAGDLEGAQFEHFMGFKHEVGARINREALLAYGLEDPEGIETIEDLDDRIGQLTGRTAEVGVGYKDGYIQIRVSGSRPPANKVQSDIPSDTFPEQKPAASFASAAGSDDETIPF